MKTITGAFALFGLLLGATQPSGRPLPDLQPTPLEAFAQMPATHIAWSKEIARIDSSDAHAVVTALILEDTARPPDRMRGVRIDLRNQSFKDQIYLGEETLAAYRDALNEISQLVKMKGKQPQPGQMSYYGAGIFCCQIPRVHALGADDYIAPDSSGLRLSAYKGEEFRFPGQDAAELAKQLSEAIKQLNAQ